MRRLLGWPLLFASVAGIAFALGILGAPVWAAAIILAVILLAIAFFTFPVRR